LFYGPDVDGRPSDLHSERMGSIPTVSTKLFFDVLVAKNGAVADEVIAAD
jgi:hypothetical protein